ncbi:MAG: pyridoxamine 5'-phosphate oxidase, partial [Bacteroidota bacterium]
MTDKDTSRDISSIRKDYALKTLSEAELLSDPIAQFEQWFDECIASEVLEPNAMTLSTVDDSQSPSSRIVLLKGIENDHFWFFTNYQSSKGQQMAGNPNVSLLFFWPELQRQVRINGLVSKLTAAQSDDYFHSRPQGSQIGALASPQSDVISSREMLETRVTQLTKQYQHQEIPRPSHWGGYQ